MMALRTFERRGAAALLAAVIFSGPLPARSAEPLRDAPVIWWEDDRNDIAEPDERAPNLARDQLHTTLARPVRRHTSPSAFVRWVGTAFGSDRWSPARNVNALDEVPNSTWFTNRIGLYVMSPADVARGPGTGAGPDQSEPWVVVGAKSEGVTPGFNIRDALGDVYLIKFDPKGYLGTTSNPGVITGRVLHAAGYNVPDDAIVTFRKEDLILGDGVTIKEFGIKREMTQDDLDAILERVDRLENGDYPALSSRFLSGRPIGPFDYKNRRDDDPNDHVLHGYRRELRGLRVFAAWVNHFDTKQHNSLDMYVEEDGAHFVKHHLIDFASTLGSGGSGSFPKHGREHGFNGPAVLKRIVTVGLVEDEWRQLERPADFPEVGYFDSDRFAVSKFEPLTPNTAFAMMTDRDEYWAAKIISAFSDDALTAMVGEARYSNPGTAPYVARILAERRDIIARDSFLRVCPVDFFRVENGQLSATDLGVNRGIWTAAQTRYQIRSGTVDAERNAASPLSAWQPTSTLQVALPSNGAGAFQAIEFQVDRGSGWGPSVTVYVAAESGRVIGVDR